MDKEVIHRRHQEMLDNVEEEAEELALQIVDMKIRIARLRTCYTHELYDKYKSEKNNLYDELLEIHNTIEYLLDELGDVVDLCI